MSFQRIFEMVKRQGLPLMITDGQGSEPLVVLPFDLYEALVDGSGHSSNREASAPSVQEPIMVPVRDESSVADPIERASEPDSGKENTSAKSEAGSDFSAEFSVEERFYIEPPLEEKNG